MTSDRGGASQEGMVSGLRPRVTNMASKATTRATSLAGSANASSRMREPGEAFGLPQRRSLTTFTSDGVERRSDEREWPFETYETPWAALPKELAQFVYEYPTLVMEAVDYWGRELPSAHGMILNHATNDVLILLHAVGDGSGRTAARTARALFEHLIHFREVSGSVARAEQYEAHAHVTADQLSRRRAGLHMLAGAAKRREKRALDTLGRRSKNPLAEATARWGPAFRKGWTAGEPLYQMAQRHGLEDDYEAYRILSGVMHGSAGALFGTRREDAGVVTHRLGPDLRLVPLSFLEGIRWWKALVDELPPPPVSPDWGVPLREATDALIGAYPEVLATCQRLDNRLWPSGPVPPRYVAVLAVYASGKARWFLHDVRASVLWPAELVGDPPSNLEELKAGMQPLAEEGLGRPASSVVLNTEVKAIEGARPAPAASLLLPHDVYGPVGLPVSALGGTLRSRSTRD